MSAVVETDFVQPPVIYPEGFIKAVAEGNALGNTPSHESIEGSGSSSGSNTSQTQLQHVSKEEVLLQSPKERHPSSGSAGSHSKREDSEQPVEYYCGVGRCRPKWMQRLRDARFFTFLLCCNCFIEGALVSGE